MINQKYYENLGGYLFGYNTKGLNDINEMPVMEDAYKLGKSV